MVETKITKVSDLPAEKESIVEAILLDRKVAGRVTRGKEDNLEEIAEEFGFVSDEEVPAGTSTISGPTVSASQVLTAIANDLGPTCSGGKVFMSDAQYFLYPTQHIEKVLSEDLTDVQMWINTYFDCDDFAQVVAGYVNQQLKGIPFGTLWFKGPGIYHAVNCFYSMEEKKIKIVEPQTDHIYNFNKSRYCPMLVVI
jgi:hypothetical protein